MPPPCPPVAGHRPEAGGADAAAAVPVQEAAGRGQERAGQEQLRH